MSLAQREIIRQGPPPKGVQVAADDRYLTRWLWNASAPISLADYSASRFVGKFDDDILPAKRLVAFQPGMARSLGPYEHPAFTGTQADMGISHVETMLSIPVAGMNPATGQVGESPKTAYNNNPKICAYMLMRDYERRGLCLFEDMRGTSDEEIMFLFDMIIPPEIEAQWARETRTVLDHDFRGPFLDQYKAWLGSASNSPLLAWFNANIGKKKSLQRKESDRLGAMGREMRAAVNRAWSWENTMLNTTEQQIRRYRNGHKGKEFYDMPDERFANPIPPLDLLCLADTNRQPLDLQQVEAANVLNKGTQDAMMSGMETFADRIASKMQPGLTLEAVDKLIQERLDAQAAHYQLQIDALNAQDVPENPVTS